MKLSRKLSLLTVSLACAFAAHAQTVKETPNSQFKPTGKGWGELDNVATAASSGWCASPDRKAWSTSCTPRQ